MEENAGGGWGVTEEKEARHLRKRSPTRESARKLSRPRYAKGAADSRKKITAPGSTKTKRKRKDEKTIIKQRTIPQLMGHILE